MAGPVFALNPALDVSQYAHTAWKIRGGFAKAFIRSIAQPPDGGWATRIVVPFR